MAGSGRCAAPRSAFAGFRFPAEVIVVAVRWYLRYGLSYRDVEELLVERGIEVDHVTVYRWVQRFTPLLADAARFTRHAPGDRWFVDETYVKVNGAWRYVYRAVDPLPSSTLDVSHGFWLSVVPDLCLLISLRGWAGRTATSPMPTTGGGRAVGRAR